MTNLDDITAIRAHFLATWNQAIPVIFANDPYEPEPTSIWAQFSVNAGDERRMSIAQSTYEQIGRIYLQVMIPDGQRDHEGQAIADAFATTFRDLRLDNHRIRFEPASFGYNDADPDYFIIEVSVKYRAMH